MGGRPRPAPHLHADHIAGAEVLQFAREGKSLEEMKTLIKLSKYEKSAGYQQMFPLNIEGMYRHVQMHRRPNP